MFVLVILDTSWPVMDDGVQTSMNAMKEQIDVITLV